MARPRQLPPLDPQDAPREPNTGRTFTQKLGIYLTGVAIGLMFFGWTQARKNSAARQKRAQQQTQVETPAPESIDGAVDAEQIVDDLPNEPTPSSEPSPG